MTTRETTHMEMQLKGGGSDSKREGIKERSGSRNSIERHSILNSLPRYSGQNRSDMGGLRMSQSKQSCGGNTFADRGTAKPPFFDRDNSLDNDEI